MSQLGQQNITAGDIRRYQIDYTQFLQPGEVLTAGGFTVTSSGATSTARGAFLNITETQLYFFVTGGNLNESFTVSVQVKTSFGETINDTIAFTVVAA